MLSLVLSFLIFGNGLFGHFVFDDVTVIENRGDLKDPDNFLKLFISPYHQNLQKTGLFRPLTMASYAINHFIDGRPAGFHAVNIIIHALNSFLVFWLTYFLFKNRFLSFSTFLLFLSHPIHTEAVTSLVGRAELLAFFWSLAAIGFFVKKRLFWSSVSFLLGLLSKEVVLMVLPIIFYIDWGILKNKLFFTARRMAVLMWPIGLYSLLRYKALGSYFFGDAYTTVVENPLKFASFGERILTAFKVLYLYMEKLVWPVRLSADYSFNAITLVQNFYDWRSLFGLGFLVFLLIILLLKKTNKTTPAFGSLAFLAPYLMISNLIKPVGTIMGERLMYFPSLGFVILLSWGLLFLSRKLGNKPVYILLALILAFYSIRTVVRNKDWHDARTLFSATVKESPGSLIARTALAAVYIKADEWGEAKEQLDIAQGIYKDNSHLQNILGIMADHEGNYQLAEERYKKSLELNPDAIIPHINLAELYLKTGRMTEAGASFKKVIDFYPVTEYVIRYAYIQIALNDPEEAIATVNQYFRDVLKDPDLSALVGTAYFVKRDYQQAVVFLKRAVELGNTAPEIKQMLELIKVRH